VHHRTQLTGTGWKQNVEQTAQTRARVGEGCTTTHPSAPTAPGCTTGSKGGAGDGMESDAAGNLYATEYEHNAILRRPLGGQWDTIGQGRRAPAVAGHPLSGRSRLLVRDREPAAPVAPVSRRERPAKETVLPLRNTHRRETRTAGQGRSVSCRASLPLTVKARPCTHGVRDVFPKLRRLSHRGEDLTAT
jgi:hypothetical protein